MTCHIFGHLHAITLRREELKEKIASEKRQSTASLLAPGTANVNGQNPRRLSFNVGRTPGVDIQKNSGIVGSPERPSRVFYDVEEEVLARPIQLLDIDNSDKF